MVKIFNCDICQRILPCKEEGAIGYVLIEDNKRICYDCCAQRDCEQMIFSDRIILYYGRNGLSLTNWPRTLELPITSLTYRHHNFGITQTYVRFFGPDGARWSGRNLGENTMFRCRKLTKQLKHYINNKPTNILHKYNYT